MYTPFTIITFFDFKTGQVCRLDYDFCAKQVDEKVVLFVLSSDTIDGGTASCNILLELSRSWHRIIQLANARIDCCRDQLCPPTFFQLVCCVFHPSSFILGLELYKVLYLQTPYKTCPSPYERGGGAAVVIILSARMASISYADEEGFCEQLNAAHWRLLSDRNASLLLLLPLSRSKAV